jgi:hypothetical protein
VTLTQVRRVDQVRLIEDRRERHSVLLEQFEEFGLGPLHQPRLDQGVNFVLVLPLHRSAIAVARIAGPLRLTHELDESDPLVELRGDHGDEPVTTTQDGVRIGAVASGASRSTPRYPAAVDEAREVVAGEEQAKDVVDRDVDVLAPAIASARMQCDKTADGRDEAALQLGLPTRKRQWRTVDLTHAVAQAASGL